MPPSPTRARGGNRFNGEDRGAWYCGITAETSLREVSDHLTRELEAIERFDNVTDYAELMADFVLEFGLLWSLALPRLSAISVLCGTMWRSRRCPRRR
ncbi:MAG: RES family NAD+ phosphorylase [Devosia sp.]